MANRFQIARMNAGDMKIVLPSEEELHRLSLNMSEAKYKTLEEKAEKCYLLAERLSRKASTPRSHDELVRRAALYMHMEDKDYQKLCRQVDLEP